MNGAGRGPFVVVAGIPGSGKTTALREIVEAHPHSVVLVVDSDSVRRSLRARLPRVPYPILRPVVHAVHRTRIGALALTESRPLLIHEVAAGRMSRAALLLIARLARRPARLVWIDVDVETAWRGQLARDRVIRPGAFRRHVRRVGRLHRSATACTGWDSARWTDREGAVAAISAAARITIPAGGR